MFRYKFNAFDTLKQLMFPNTTIIQRKGFSNDEAIKNPIFLPKNVNQKPSHKN